MEPFTYKQHFTLANDDWFSLAKTLPWEHRTPARSECFVSRWRKPYTYGSGLGQRTYLANPIPDWLRPLWMKVERETENWFELCFFNRYANEKQHLGWHADDLGGMDHDRPIAVVSFGASREIWVREKPADTERADQLLRSGLVPQDLAAPLVHRQLLEPCSLFVMPPGMQRTHQHRIPKNPFPCGPRISLTFRGFVE